VAPLAAAGFAAIAPDLRGMGYSKKTKDGYSKVNVAEDVRAIVSELGFSEVNLVGGDIGAMVAYAYASRHPQEVSRFVFGEAFILGFGLEDHMNPATGCFWHFGFQGEVDTATMLVEGREEKYLMPFYRLMSAHGDVEKRMRERFLPFFEAPRGHPRRLRALRHADRRREGEPGAVPRQATHACAGSHRRERRGGGRGRRQRPARVRTAGERRRAERRPHLRRGQPGVGRRTSDPLFFIRTRDMLPTDLLIMTQITPRLRNLATAVWAILPLI
jgi:pimeloyl-ACP methyl ester carboxylesterase